MDRIFTQGIKDPVTGFFTLDELAPFLERLKEESAGSGKPFSVMTLDLDHFKRSRTRWDAGDDQVFNFFASALRLSCPVKNTVAFCSPSDRFVLVFVDRDSPVAYRAGKVMERRIRRMPFVLNKWKIRLNFSAGISAFPADDQETDGLLAKSEAAMCTAVKLGGGRVCQYTQRWHEALKPYLIPIPLLILGLLLAVFLSYSPKK